MRGGGRRAAERVVTIFERIGTAEGSTRPIALVRIGLVLIVWARWASDFQVSVSSRPDWLLLGASYYLSSLCLLVGFHSRFAAAWHALTLALILGWLDGVLHLQRFIYYHTVLMTMCVGLLAFTECGRSYSLDRWLALRRALRGGAPAPPESGPLWGTWLLPVNTTGVYFWGAYDKLNLGWFSGDRMEMIYLSVYGGSELPEFPGFHLITALIGTGTVVTEFVLAFGLWVPSWRKLLMPVGILFHLGIYYTLPVYTFSLTMILVYLLYLPADRVHAFIDELSGPQPPRAPD
jgi:hypothetical protein